MKKVILGIMVVLIVGGCDTIDNSYDSKCKTTCNDDGTQCTTKCKDYNSFTCTVYEDNSQKCDGMGIMSINDIYAIYDAPETIISDDGDEVLVEFEDDTAILFENMEEVK